MKRRKRGGGGGGGVPKVAEATRIHIRRTLEEFRASNDDVYTFDADLSNFDRAEVHVLCRKMGMKSRSTGSKTGNKRCVSVYKFKGKSEKPKAKSDLTSFTFSEEGKEVLTDFFSLYPPGEHGEAEKTATTSSKNSGNTRKTDDILCKPIMKKAEIAKKLESVTARMESDLKLKQVKNAIFADAATGTAQR
ncbi:helicase in vascular tissue and tapetum [Artemisia annua]|uniref:Helicase in vascular tissue and tapetum n=1 Tax=Artemisia annua TaxID=35608 RepID=A0A2U1LNA7_ARTAN|nr:helicase in vascular tissue and tapetum [Artemisia annua]